MEIRDKIKDWYLINKRPLPWRKIRDPYRIWVSEIILQQTRVMQGMDYYHRFLERFPDIRSLALAEEAEVLKVWEGLGYYSRARNMHAAAKKIHSELEGIFPETYSDILDLKGVGPYTAAAVSSIAFNEPRAVVDGNVHRVLSRLFGIEEPANGYSTGSRIARKASELLDHEDPGMHNQAVMELGALVCTPASPLCPACPLRDDCVAFALNRTGELPLKTKKIIRRKRYFHYLHIQDEEGIWLGRRKDKDIWNGLYELPVIETSRPFSSKSIRESEAWSALLGSPIQALNVTRPIKHNLSHQEIYAKFYLLNENPLNALAQRGYEKIRMQDLERYPVHKLIQNYMNKIPK